LSDVAELVTCAGKPIFVVDASDQHAAKAARSIQGAWKAVRRCGKRAGYESPRHSRAVAITAHAIKRKAGSRCDMSCVPYAA